MLFRIVHMWTYRLDHGPSSREEEFCDNPQAASCRVLREPVQTWMDAGQREAMARILVVDDQVDIRRLIRIALGRSHEVAEAEDGAAGLAMARQFRPDLVVLDVMMPGGMDGLQVLDAIRDDPDIGGAKVILLTARGQAKDFEEGMSRGADAYVVKPFSPAQLANSINELLVA